MDEPHIIPLRTYYTVFAALMLLLVATVGFSYMPLGRWHLATALAIAGIKAALIIMFFMHVRYSNKLTWVFSGAAFLWLAILVILSLSDYSSRGWLNIEGK